MLKATAESIQACSGVAADLPVVIYYQPNFATRELRLTCVWKPKGFDIRIGTHMDVIGTYMDVSQAQFVRAAGYMLNTYAEALKILSMKVQAAALAIELLPKSAPETASALAKDAPYVLAVLIFALGVLFGLFARFKL